MEKERDGKMDKIDSLVRYLAYDNAHFALDEEEKKIALDLLERLSNAGITVSRAKEIINFCICAIELTSKVGC